MSTDSSKTTNEQKAADAKPARRGDLLRAGEATDPTVQKLLAERQAHVSNAGLEVDPAVAEQRKAALKQIAAIDEQLEELGYTAK